MQVLLLDQDGVLVTSLTQQIAFNAGINHNTIIMSAVGAYTRPVVTQITALQTCKRGGPMDTARSPSTLSASSSAQATSRTALASGTTMHECVRDD